MTGLKKRILIGTVLAILILIGWFYYVYFASTDAITRHAEDFKFRRMKVAQLSEQGTYRFFYISNRKTGPDSSSLDERFGTEREEMLKFGFFDTRIEPALGLGMIIDATAWFQNEEIRLEDVRDLEQSAFVEQVQKLVQNSPHKSLLVIIHETRVV